MRPLTFLIVAVGLSLLAQAPPPGPTHPGARPAALPADLPSSVLINEIKARQEVVANVEYLADVIGARLTGSDRLVLAHDWAEAKLKGYGLTVLPREAYDFGKPWTRGTAKARLLTHNQVTLQVAQFAWSPATPGAVKGEVIAMDGDIDDMVAMIGKFKGKIVLMSGRPKPKGDIAEFRAKFMKVMRATQEEGVAATLIAGGMKEGLFSMTGSPGGPMSPTTPMAFLSPESTQLLSRLVKRKEKVEIELELGGVVGEASVQAYNTLAEIRGSEKPEEVVLLGAHLDSWDLAGGATDNATGVAAVMEAMRALKASGLQPKRTIRAALFSGEEQGLFGAEAYVKARKAELVNHQAVLVHDGGTGRVRGWSLQGREDVLPFMAKALSTQNDLGNKELPLESNHDTDHAPFLPFGVPAFSAIQEGEEEYMKVTHHSQVDHFDHVKPEGLIQGAQALAVTAWELASMPERLPQRPPAPRGAPASASAAATPHKH